MPMVVYTEEELIDACNKAEAEGAERAAKDRDRAMSENTMLRRRLNDCKDALRAFADMADRIGKGDALPDASVIVDRCFSAKQLLKSQSE